MEDLVVKSTSIIHPRNVVNQSDNLVINLTPWDLSRLRYSYPQRGLLFPKPKSFNIDTIISNFKTSLSIALDHFYTLAGHLVKKVNENDDSVSYFISCDGSGHGVKFVHAVAKTIAVKDMVKSGFIGGSSGSFFFPANGIKNYQGVSNPLLMVQVTEMKDGIFICFSYNQTVADGKSLWKFINAWSEICSKDDSTGISPSFRGWFLDEIEYPIHIQDPELIDSTSSYGSSTKTSNILLEVMFRLTIENVLKLKAKANEEIGFEEISSFQAVLGHIWRSRVKNGDMSREEETYCRVPVDMRQRLNPKLEEECFGNVVQTGMVKVNVGDMLDNGLGWLAMKINQMVKSQTDENAKAFAESWVRNGEIPVSVSGGGSSTLLVASSPRFNVYGNDFGWGKPIGLRSGPPLIDGKLLVSQGVKEGDIEFQACFETQVVVKLVKDAEFLEYVDIVS